jgi:hypothetical protein
MNLTRKYWLPALLVAGLHGGSAAAQEPLDFAAMAAQCQTDRAGFWRFGDELTGLLAATNVGPYEKGLARTTSWSDRVASVELTVEQEDESTGKAQEQALVAAFEAAGWTRAEDLTTIDIGLILIESNHVLMPPGHDDPATAPVFAGVSWFPGMLRMTCTSGEWSRLDRAEMDGDLGDGSPRPAPLPAITAVRPIKDNCADPAYVADIDDALFDGDAWVDQSAMRARQALRLETWMRWKLLGSGKVNEDQLWALEDRAVATETDDPEARLVQGMEMLSLFPEIEAARKAGDNAALCPLYIRIVDIMATEDKRRLDRWARIEPLYLEAAAPAGVDLSH